VRDLFFALLTGLLIPAAQAASYTIDPHHTYPNFTISHLGFSTMHGRFGKTRGTIEMDLAAGTGRVSVIIDAASVDTGYKVRDDDLRSPSFLNAAEFPEITYQSTRVRFESGRPVRIDGKLTIAGATRSVTLTVTHMKCGTNPFSKKAACGFDAGTRIKRSDFGIKYGLPLIGDEMALFFEVEAVKN